MSVTSEDRLPAKAQPKDSRTDLWRICPGCQRERRLARHRSAMTEHYRFVPVAWERVPCEGSGQQPAPQDQDTQDGAEEPAA